MKTKPRLLDLFCGAGGAAMGYHRAGFEVVGVDIKPQPHYPFEFHQADALEYPLGGFPAIHASPPCQAYSIMRDFHKGAKRKSHPDLLGVTRNVLNRARGLWVIENVPGAPMRADYILCGSQFGLRTIRHRWFEVSWGPIVYLTLCCRHTPDMDTIVGHGTPPWVRERRKARGAHPTIRQDEKREIMQMPWANRDEISQAIPPAYTQFIGEQLLKVLSI